MVSPVKIAPYLNYLYVHSCLSVRPRVFPPKKFRLIEFRCKKIAYDDFTVMAFVQDSASAAMAGPIALGAGIPPAAGGITGSWIVKVVPSPGRLSTSILPPWDLTMRSQIGRPKPKPRLFFEVKNG
jgi:hypothetical protein